MGISLEDEQNRLDKEQYSLMYGYRVEKYKGTALGNCLFYSLESFSFLFRK